MLTTERIKALAGYLVEADEHFSFGLQDEDNVKAACIEIAQAGFRVDMEHFMGVYYFNFPNKKIFDKAVGVVSRKIDVSGESEFKPKKGQK